MPKKNATGIGSPKTTRRNFLKTLAFLANLAALTCAQEKMLLGLRHRNNTANGALNMVSMAGGLELFIDGDGMDDEPIINSVLFWPTQAAKPENLIGPALNIDDQIQSATSLGRLAYSMPSITQIYGNVPMENFSTHYISNKNENIEHVVSIQSQADGAIVGCQKTMQEPCTMRYSMRYTPLLHDVSPSNVYFDQQLSFILNPQGANDKNVIEAGYDPVVFIKLSGTRADAEGFYDNATRLANYRLGHLKSKAGDQKPGKQIPEVRFRVGNAYLRQSAKHCNFDGDDCWFVKTHPKIDSISSTDGYTTGGQTLTISGWGLKGKSINDVKISVDGVPCTVMSHEQDEIVCVTNAAAGVSLNEVSQPGSPGLTQHILDSADQGDNPYWQMRYDGKVPIVETKLLTAFENSFNNYTRAGTVTKGWFKAPATGKYRFYISCDDACQLFLDSNNKFDKDSPVTPAPSQIAMRAGASAIRDYLMTPPENQNNYKYQSDWISLEESEFYKIEGFMFQYGGDDHYTVSVEFEKADTAGHHHANKEIQILSIDPENVQETFTITVTGAMGGKYTVMLVNPLYDAKVAGSIKIWKSDFIKDNDSADWVASYLRNYYITIWGSNIQVTSTSYDSNDIATKISANVAKTVYTVTVHRQIQGPSFTMASIVPSVGTTSTITISAPITQSTTPLSGSFFIECPNTDGNSFRTRDFAYTEADQTIDFLTQLEIPHLQFKTLIRGTGKYAYRENGLSLQLVFQDYHGDVPQCEIKSSVVTPLAGNNLTLNSVTFREYGKNLFFEPIPLEFIYANAQKPQVRVSVNGIDAVCPNFNCDYLYIETEKVITGQTLTNGVDLTITGTGLPTDTNHLVVKFANVQCPLVTASETEITCSLDAMPAAGSWNVQVIDLRGLIPIDASVNKIAVGLVITSISPNSALNQLGGDILTLNGSGFDDDISHTTISFSDKTSCVIIDANDKKIKCIPSGFDTTLLDTSQPYIVNVAVNEVTNTEMTVMLLTNKQSGQTVTPNSVSPVLATILTVTLEPTYPVTLESPSDFQAYLVSRDDPKFTRPLYVMKVDDATKTLKIKFPGADSGNYNIQLIGKDIGKIDKEPLALTVTGRVTGISPLTGSYLGGTLVTIHGVNFSNDPLDNPVKVGPYWCLVQTSSVDKITCRVSEAVDNSVSSVKVLTFLRTSEEAINLVSNIFEFSDPIAQLTGLSNAFDAATNTQVITVEGTGFPGVEGSGVTLLIDGVEQTALVVTETTATFTLIDITDESSADLKIYFPDGLPAGYKDFSSIKVVPTLVSVSPRAGSSGGTLLTVTGTGFGIKTLKVNLLHKATGVEICAEVHVTGYGTFTCLTKVMEINSSDEILLQTASGSYTCGNTLNAAECSFEQLSANSPSVIGAAVNSPTSILITGASFPTSGYDAIVIFKGIESSSAVITDATSITAIFENGVPLSDIAAAPSLRFVPTISGRRLASLSEASMQLIATQINVTFTNTLTVQDSTSGLSCSFQGGCPYKIKATGLTASLINSKTNRIDVCGNPCVIDTKASDVSQTTCTLPYLATAYSAETYEIVSEGLIHDGEWTGTATAAELAKLIDGKNMADLQDKSTSPYFQIKYKESHVGVLNEVKFFISRLINKTPFIGNLIFQGSDDGKIFQDLWTVDKNVHEGWNTKKFDGVLPSYNIYRFKGKVLGSCRISEVKIFGVVAIDNDQTSYSCIPKLNLEGISTALNPVKFDAAFTPVLTGMSTRFGSVLGGEQVEFYGVGFSSTATTTVTIDNRVCKVDLTTVDTIKCTTSDKPYVPDMPMLEINIAGFGLVATKGKVFLYISRWSDDQTWGYDLSPQEGEAVNIPKGLHLLVDVDSTPVLSFINVEGSLIFPPDKDPNHQRTFDCYYIMVKMGYLEIGTEEYRYTSKLTITMHGSRETPKLPIFGNKVIGVHFGTLEMHGAYRPVTWTDLKKTVNVGETSITLNDVIGDPLDWKVGEEIVIASTDFSGRNAEQRTIASITNQDTNPVITFTEPLQFKHYADIQYFGDEFIEMRAEVGLLTRNVKYQGDPTSVDNQYGAVIIMHSPGDESTAARIDGIELTNVGQAFILGSYPIHFHMIGTVHSSYVRNNAIHHTYNRAVTIHGVHFLRVQNNVAYRTMGHTIFIEDAIETKNLIEGNLIVDVRRSWSLLNTDQSPASIWITSPDNIIRNNHAAGSDRYSYWFDLQITSIGPSFDANICPENDKLGEFRDNVAHSNGRYGLRIFHNHLPRTYPCLPMVYNPADPANPYPTNPPIVAEFHNLVSYKNKRDGAIAELVGAMEWHNFKTADNLEAGMEVSMTSLVDGFCKIVGGLVVGRSANTEEALDKADSPKGIINPRTENFQVIGTKFYNYDWNNAAGLGTCSHCWHDLNTDSGARTITVSDLYFDKSVIKRVMYTTPFRCIFFDKTGGLTNYGPNSWFLPFWHHLLQPECKQEDVMGGIVCNQSVQVRRVAFHGLPAKFNGMRMKIAKIDDSFTSTLTDVEYKDYLQRESNYAVVPYKDKGNPSSAWAMPYVTGHKYRLHWESGLDFDKMQVEISERWKPTDLDTFFVFNYTESREAVNFTNNYGNKPSVQIANGTLETKAPADYVSGDNLVKNHTDIRTFEFVVNGKAPANRLLKVQPLLCITGVCVLAAVEEKKLENRTRLWSEPKDWASGKLPVDGEEVEIQSGWNMILDIAQTPILKSLNINGRLTFKNTTDIHLRAQQIFVRAGELHIGSAEYPFLKSATITLMGGQKSDVLKLAGTVKAGNKVLGVSNLAKMYGIARTNMRRLLATVQKGDTKITVDPGHDWVAGDELYLAPTAMQNYHSDYMTIASVNGGEITFTQPLQWYHYGDSVSSADELNGVDIRGEVILLTRNIKILGEDIDGWGGQVLASDIFEIDGTLRVGQLYMDNVQVYNCSQKDTRNAAIRFENALGGFSRISNSVFHNGLDFGVSVFQSNNVELINNSFIGFRQVGMRIDNARNCTITGNFIGDIYDRAIKFLDSTVDKMACVAYCSLESSAGGTPCYDMTFTDNIAAGCPFAGYVAPGYETCGVNKKNFYNNIAHSVKGYGAYIYPPPQSASAVTCFETSHFSGYKNSLPCVMILAHTIDLQVHDITCIDNQLGISLGTGKQENDVVKITLKDSFIYGESKSDDCPQGGDCFCENKFAMMNVQNQNDGKDLMPTMASALPIYKSHGEGNWGGTNVVSNTKFINFVGKSKCGARHVIFERNPFSSDKIPPIQFNSCHFKDVDDNGFAFLEKPNPGWANLDDCASFPCTAPNNLIFSFNGSTYEGIKPSTPVRDFTIVPDDETVGGTYPNCIRKPAQQAYICQTNNIGMLMFENLDEDGWDRAIQPIFIINEKTGFNNTINAMMDHIWDKFYTGQRRMPRFPAALWTDEDYTMYFSGTNPKKMRFQLDARVGATKIKIPYQMSTSIQVWADGKKKSYTPWDDTLGSNAPLTKTKGCGENRFVGIENYLEFYITPGCMIEIDVKDSIMTKVRMDWTLAEFYAEGGTTRFVDRLAASLGINANRIKTVAVYKGSVIVDFIIEAEEIPGETSTQAAAKLKTIKQKLVAKTENGSLKIGAPVMGLEGSDGELLAGTPIPPPPTITYSGKGNSAVVGKNGNIWDSLVPKTTTNSTATTPITPTTKTPTGNTNPVEQTTTSPTTPNQVDPATNPVSGSTQTSITKKPNEVYVVTEQAAVADDEKTSDNLLMIVIPSALIGILLIVALVITIRVCVNKKKTLKLQVEAASKVKTQIIEVEPQFVLAADDINKDIFSRAGGNEKEIESSETKKRTKKIVIRKRKAGNSSKEGNKEMIKEEQDQDDGFENYSPDRSHRSPDVSSARFFNSSMRESTAKMVPDVTKADTTRKMINLHQIQHE